MIKNLFSHTTTGEGILVVFQVSLGFALLASNSQTPCVILPMSIGLYYRIIEYTYLAEQQLLSWPAPMPHWNVHS